MSVEGLSCSGSRPGSGPTDFNSAQMVDRTLARWWKKSRLWFLLAAAVVLLVYVRQRYVAWFYFGAYDDQRALAHPVSLWGPEYYESPLTLMTQSEMQLSTSTDLPFVRTCIIIPTAFVTAKRRVPIRRQWKRMNAGGQVSAVMKFFIGLKGLKPDQVAAARKEANVHGDIVLLEDQADFDNGEIEFGSATSIKVLEAFKWAVTHYQFDYLVRQSDDGYFNLLEFQRVTPSSMETDAENKQRLDRAKPLIQVPLHRTRWCRFYYENPVREEKLRKFYRMNVWPPYCLGLGWVLTRDLVLFAAQSQIPLLTTYAEDTVSGVWFAGLQINNIDDERFHHLGPQPATHYAAGKLGQQEYSPERWAEAPCKKTDLLIHYMTEYDWDLIGDDGSMSCV